MHFFLGFTVVCGTGLQYNTQRRTTHQSLGRVPNLGIRLCLKTSIYGLGP